MILCPNRPPESERYAPEYAENTFSLNLKLEFFNEKSLLILEFYQKSILDFDATIL